MARILVIDDDENLRQGLRKALTAKGHVVTEAGHGREAVRLMEGESVDLVITDMHMPDMDGIEVVTFLEEQESRPKILAISGGWSARAGEEVLLDAKLLGADQILEKPFTLQELNSVLEKTLSGREDEEEQPLP